MSFSSAIGKSIIVSAPSGAGKTTLVRKLMECLPQLAFSISACSRPPRETETHGIDYYFMGVESFKQSIKEDSFVEWEEVYKNHFYGTLKEEVNRLWSLGKVIIFDVDVVGGLNLKKQFNHNALAIFIKPPSINVLENRLRARKTESEERIELRLQKAIWEVEQEPLFDVCIINDQLEVAVSEAINHVKNFLET